MLLLQVQVPQREVHRDAAHEECTPTSRWETVSVMHWYEKWCIERLGAEARRALMM
jgi:hypothetical protein